MRKNVLWLVVLAVMFVAVNAFAKVDCDLGVYSKYINGVGGVADGGPVVQGECTKSFTNGVYINGWFSQSLKEPGLDKTYGNEIDASLGWSGKIAEKWSLNAHTAYFDITNDRLLQTNGDLVNFGGTVRYHIAEKAYFYSNVETYYGIGSRAFPNGWIAGLGARADIANIVNVDAIVYHNEHFFGHGKFLKMNVETTRPIAKFAGGELRPLMTLWQPIGNYNDYDTQVVAGLRMNW